MMYHSYLLTKHYCNRHAVGVLKATVRLMIRPLLSMRSIDFKSI